RDLPPVITSAPPLQAVVGQEYVYAVRATDPDGETPLFALRSAPLGMVIDPTSGLIRWTPTDGEVGADAVGGVALDPRGAAGFQDFSVSVARANHAPQIQSLLPLRIVAGLTYQYDVRATDADGDPLTYALSGDTRGLTIDGLGRIRGDVGAADAGTHHLVVTV